MRTYRFRPDPEARYSCKHVACTCSHSQLGVLHFSCSSLLRARSPGCRMKVFRTGRKLSLPRGIVLPTHSRVVVRHLSHRDAVLHGTHRRTEIATHACLLDDLHNRTAAIPLEAPDRLMRAIL